MKLKADFAQMPRRSASGRVNSQASLLKGTDLHGIALRQADRQQEVLPPLRLSVVDPLREANVIFRDALCHNPQHDEACAARRFAKHNSYLPASHSAWKSAPACTCWVGRLANWLKNNPEI